MLADYILSFPAGSLLTGQLLQKMYEYPKELIHCIFADYSEGVIAGLDVRYENQKLILSRGIYKHNTSLYLLENETIIAENYHFEGAKWYAILEEETKEDYNITVRHLKIKVTNLNEDESKQFRKDNLILFSFRNIPTDDIRVGAYNLFDYKHACLGKEATFMPQLFKPVYEKLISKNVKHPLDYVIINEILARGIVSCELMRIYIKSVNPGTPCAEDRQNLMIAFWNAISAENFNNMERKNLMQRNEDNESCLW